MDEGKFERIEKTIDVWYEGVMVMGTNIMLKWEMAENMVRPQSASQWQASDYRARDSNNTGRHNRLSQDSGRKIVYHRKTSASTHMRA